MSNYEFIDSSNKIVDLDDCYNPYTSGTKADDTGFNVDDIDISNRYNKLGTTSNLKYNFTNNYIIGINTPLNNIFELNLINTTLTTCSYSGTAVTDGVLLRITGSGNIFFNYKLNNIPIVLVGGGGAGGGTSYYNAGGGGGGGEVLETTIPENSIAAINVVIGNGGTGGSANGVNGGTSTITTTSTTSKTYGAFGGGGGGTGKAYGLTGGSGGGGGSYSNAGTIGGSTAKYTNPAGIPPGKVFAGGAGEDQNNDTGGGGGGGGAGQAGTSGVNYKGGDGYTTTTLNGTLNTGGGGGGGANSKDVLHNPSQSGAHGGSGVLYILIQNTNVSF